MEAIKIAVYLQFKANGQGKCGYHNSQQLIKRERAH
jgi:hypothetical protein